MVTGANAGIGKATALGLAKMGAKVVMVCRSRERGEVALAEITRESWNDSVSLLFADLSSQTAIRNLAADLTASNVATDVTSDCFCLNGLNMTVTGNKGYECGSSNGKGFWVRGSGDTVTDNYVRGAVSDGFFVDGSGHTLTTNIAEHGYKDGFDIQATGVTLTSNRSLSSTGSGFEIDTTAASTTLTGNVVTGVGAIGLCDLGTSTTADPLANNFGTLSVGRPAPRPTASSGTDCPRRAVEAR